MQIGNRFNVAYLLLALVALSDYKQFKNKNMTEYKKTIEAIKTLQEHNAWRLGNEKYEMKEPKEITEAIRIVCDNYRYIFSCNFFERLKSFVSNVQVNDMPSEEEKQMIINVCEYFRKNEL